ncbi:MAG TPA: hypothetical protein PLW10_18405 [Myxococcota bacterium]|nr:hypothetical protein [Myxococcales bacterium]HPG27612.1 hypothetical protein [Myxococcota bacterium]
MIDPKNRAARPLLARAASMLLLLALALAITPAPAAAQAEAEQDDLASMKADWQSRYRRLLTRQDELRAEIELRKQLYANANRRMYRGSVRQGQRDRMLEAETELAEIATKIESFMVDARRAGAYPGWLYEVEDEVAEARRNAPAAVAPDGPEDDEDDGGRNPLYDSDDDEDE